MYSIDTTKRFDKDLKRCVKRGLNLQLTLLFLRTGTHSDLF